MTADAPEPGPYQGPTPEQQARVQRIVRRFCKVLDNEKAPVNEALIALGTLHQALIQQIQPKKIEVAS